MRILEFDPDCSRRSGVFDLLTNHQFESPSHLLRTNLPWRSREMQAILHYFLSVAVILPKDLAIIIRMACQAKNRSESLSGCARFPADFLEADEEIRPQHANNAYVFLSSNNIRVHSENIHFMKAIVESRLFAPKHVRMDMFRYFIAFEASTHSNSQASDCYKYFQGRLFHNVLMCMNLVGRRHA
jgi:hypothetical protein